MLFISYNVTNTAFVFRPTIDTRSSSTNNLSTTGPGSEYSLPPSYRAPHPQPHSISPPTHITDYHPTFTSSTSLNQTLHTALTHPITSQPDASEEIHSSATLPTTKFSQICEVVAQITSDNSSQSKDPDSTLDLAEVVCVPTTQLAPMEPTKSAASRKGDLVSIVTISGCTDSESSTNEMNVLAHL